MAKADLHVHCKYSDYPSTWLHKAYDSPESFTEPEELYRQAKSRGMDFVTITDHDDIRGSLELSEAHPQDCFVSCEVTTYFPEDNCKAHVLVYGITGEQYAHISKIRRNIYVLRDYIKQQDMAYSVAHAAYDQDGKLTFAHIEKLVLLFDVFEVLNGGSSEQSNVLVHQYLRNLDKHKIEQLQAKHDIQPISDDAWVKGYTGGSDDHCGLLIGSAYTKSIAQTVDQFLDQLKNKHSLADGLHGNFQSYAVGVFKHIHDYKKDRDKKYRKTKEYNFFEQLFTGHRGNWLERFKKSRSLRYLKHKNSATHKALFRLLKYTQDSRDSTIEEKIPEIYAHVSDLHDTLSGSVLKAFSKNLPKGKFFKMFQNLSNIFPSLILASPFIGSLRHQMLRGEIKQQLLLGAEQKDYVKKALWFTDTIDDLNGVSVSLRQLAKQGELLGYQLKLVTCVDSKKIQQVLPSNTVNSLPIMQLNVPNYEQLQIQVPAMLKLIQQVVEQNPDELIVSTPGPMGLVALLCGKLLDVPVKGVYHTDFAEQALRISEEQSLADMIDYGVNWFYKQMDYVYVPSHAYIDTLSSRGHDKSKLGIFPRGLDLTVYKPKQSTGALSKSDSIMPELKGEFTLLFAGRISEDKNLSLLVEIFTLANKEHANRYNLVIAGDGPDLEKLKKDLAGQANVHFTGRLAPQALVDWYNESDLLVFPSHTDTFGMVILEAQACGLPCVVTNTGGPKEIITPNETGTVMYDDCAQKWLAEINSYYQCSLKQPEKMQQIKQQCITTVIKQNSWDNIFDYLFGTDFQSDNMMIDRDDNKQIILDETA